MKLFKTILKGIGYTILTWVALILLLSFSILCIPLVILIIPIGAFSYAHNPRLIIKDFNNDLNDDSNDSNDN